MRMYGAETNPKQWAAMKLSPGWRLFAGLLAIAAGIAFFALDFAGAAKAALVAVGVVIAASGINDLRSRIGLPQEADAFGAFVGPAKADAIGARAPPRPVPGPGLAGGAAEARGIDLPCPRSPGSPDARPACGAGRGAL